jgi:hypothetical protein
MRKREQKKRKWKRKGTRKRVKERKRAGEREKGRERTMRTRGCREQALGGREEEARVSCGCCMNDRCLKRALKGARKSLERALTEPKSALKEL